MKTLILLFACIVSSLSVHASQVRVDVRGVADYTNQFGQILLDTPYHATFLYETNTALALDTFDQPFIATNVENLIYEFGGSPYFGSIIIGDMSSPIFESVFPGIFVGVTDGPSLEQQFIAALSADSTLNRELGAFEEGILLQLSGTFADLLNGTDTILRELPSDSVFSFTFIEENNDQILQFISGSIPSSVTFAPVPLPGALLLFCSGLFTMAKLRYHQTKRKMI